MASLAKVRHTVAAEMKATTPRATTSRASSAQLQRDSDTSRPLHSMGGNVGSARNEVFNVGSWATWVGGARYRPDVQEMVRLLSIAAAASSPLCDGIGGASASSVRAVGSIGAAYER